MTLMHINTVFAVESIVDFANEAEPSLFMNFTIVELFQIFIINRLDVKLVIKIIEKAF